MNINFEPGQLTLEEARGVVALLLAIHGPTVVTGPNAQAVFSHAIHEEAANVGVRTSSAPTVEIDASKALVALREGETYRVTVTGGGGPAPTSPEEAVTIDPAAAFGSPQPAPAAPAPEITPPSEPTAGSASGVDSAGLPWDERIHSSSRATTQDGTWRYRKGVSEDTKRAVEAELKGQPASPPVPAPAPAPVAPVAPQPPSSTAPAAPTPPSAPPVSPATAPTTGLPPFPAFMSRMMPYTRDGKTSLARIGELAASLGVASLPSLAGAPELIPSLEALVMAEVGAG